MTNTLHAFEKHARHDHSQEHAVLFDKRGNVVVRRSGDFDSVGFLPAELEQARGGVLTHNHPRSLPISGADLAVANEYDLTLRAVAVDELDRMWDYTVKFAQPAITSRANIKKVFERAVADAESQLAGRDMTTRAWERESRHAALIRLSKEHGFRYSRVQINAPISEANQREVKRLRSLSDAEKVIQTEWLNPLTNSLARIVHKHADAEGKIPMSALEMIRRESRAVVQRSFLGVPMADGSLAPYIMQHGMVMPRSTYFKSLWGLMIRSATEAVDYHAAIMRKYLPPEVIRHYEAATISPFEKISEIGGFNPLHLFTGPDGKRLIDRVWSVAGDMATKLDTFLTGIISQQDANATSITNELADFMTPGKGSVFGGSGSFGAMRLARTENSAAYFRADSLAAQMDPMVETYTFFTAPEHRCCDECDDVAAGSPYPKDDMMHLPPRHPNCICGVIWNLKDNIPGIIQQIINSIKDAINHLKGGIADFIGPLSKRFVSLLFGGKPQ